MKKWIITLLLLSSSVFAQETPIFEQIWNEGDGLVSISNVRLESFGQTAGRVEIYYTPRIITPDIGGSYRLFDIPNHLAVWIWKDGIHGHWYNELGEERLFRARYGLITQGVEVKIVVTWNANGYGVLIDDVLRIHDWETKPTTVYPDPDIVSGVYGGRVDGHDLATGNFTLAVYDKPLSYDQCTVDRQGTINKVSPDINGELIDPSCNVSNTTTVNLSWTNATQNEDGSLIPAANTDGNSLESTTIYWSICDSSDQVIVTSGLEKTVPTTIPGNTETTTVDIGTAGRWCFKAIHTNVGGVSSNDSGTLVKVINIIPPNPPTGLTVSPDNLIAYAISQSSDRLVLIPVGTIPADTSCDVTMSANGHYLVPRNLVQWAGTFRAPVVFALCR